MVAPGNGFENEKVIDARISFGALEFRHVIALATWFA